jgi:hypothetical protein
MRCARRPTLSETTLEISDVSSMVDFHFNVGGQFWLKKKEVRRQKAAGICGGNFGGNPNDNNQKYHFMSKSCFSNLCLSGAAY